MCLEYAQAEYSPEEDDGRLIIG